MSLVVLGEAMTATAMLLYCGFLVELYLIRKRTIPPERSSNFTSKRAHGPDYAVD